MECKYTIWNIEINLCTLLTHALSTPEASWHTDYRDTAYIYFGGLPYEMSEGDVITIFSSSVSILLSSSRSSSGIQKPSPK